jgi:hypothetical protein
MENTSESWKFSAKESCLFGQPKNIYKKIKPSYLKTFSPFGYDLSAISKLTKKAS